MTEYIEREKAFDAVFGQFCASSDETEAALNAAIEEIRAIPAADVREVKRGKWMKSEYAGNFHALYMCSQCGSPIGCDKGTPRENGLNYCPNCGAEMKGEEDGN